jgi:glyoxylase-like metal-dependent hydrolase (beta-lactamase superfamily II)
MKVHHLNCATMRPPGGRWVDGSGPALSFAKLVCHCLLVETDAGLVLVDSGIGLADLENPRERLGRSFLWLARPELDATECAALQVERLGFARRDIRHVVLTHLDLDHAGGLADFPEALVHVHARELDAALNPRSSLERERYRSVQFQHRPRWSPHDAEGERWFGFECVRELDGLPPEILLVPLAGHTRGHSAVAVQTDRGWLLHAGDAYFHHAEMDPDARRCPPLLNVFQRVMQVEGAQRTQNQERLRQLHRESAGEVRVFSAHDATELDAATRG